MFYTIMTADHTDEANFDKASVILKTYKDIKEFNTFAEKPEAMKAMVKEAMEKRGWNSVVFATQDRPPMRGSMHGVRVLHANVLTLNKELAAQRQRDSDAAYAAYAAKQAEWENRKHA